MTEQCSLPWWVKDGGPTSIQHRLRMSAIGAGKDGSVEISYNVAMDIADLLQSAGKAMRRCEDRKWPAVALRLQSLVDAEQRAWRWAFFLLGFVCGSSFQDWALVAWRSFHAG